MVPLLLFATDSEKGIPILPGRIPAHRFATGPHAQAEAVFRQQFENIAE